MISFQDVRNWVDNIFIERLLRLPVENESKEFNYCAIHVKSDREGYVCRRMSDGKYLKDSWTDNVQLVEWIENKNLARIYPDAEEARVAGEFFDKIEMSKNLTMRDCDVR